MADSVDRASVDRARERITGLIRRTPTFRTTVPTVHGAVPVIFKLEFLQYGGSFKVRGSLNALLHAEEDGRLDDAGVVIASGGNAAIGAAWASRLRGVKCTVVVPVTAPDVKIDKLIALGADVRKVGDRYAEAAEYAKELAASSNALALHAYDLPDIVAGAGTIALEIQDDVAEPLSYVIAVGGGGLLSGVIAGSGEDDSIFGVEPSGAATLHSAVAARQPADIDIDSIAGDSLGATRIGSIAWETVRSRPVSSLIVDDDALIDARTLLWEEFRIVVEHGTAAALAAIVTGQLRPTGDKPLCVVLCGANTSLTSY